MSSIGTGYDLSASQFSPDGRVFQVEYAQKAVENSGTAIGIRGKDGIVFGVEKLVTSKLYETGANKRIFNIDRHIGMAVAGLLADARQVVENARDEASNYRSNYGMPVPLKHLTDRVSMYVHAYTLYGSVRPFGVSSILGSYDAVEGAQMFVIDPSGVSYGYHGCAIGKAKQAAKTEIEKIKNFELELSWVGEMTEGKHQLVPKNVFTEAEKYAKESLEESDESDDEDL
ncbi:PSA3-like protein [Mya arenaria]|uniref:Proteasome subunit alpha type n=1 Tax=Mya arenaria TaxID=6604 RepID=A0ABY7FER0_MYAAR|nr:PSA3-like protein [Mya arenaria]